MILSNDSGIIEMIKDSISVHSLKKEAYSKGYNKKGQLYTLYDHYLRVL